MLDWWCVWVKSITCKMDIAGSCVWNDLSSNRWSISNSVEGRSVFQSALTKLIALLGYYIYIYIYRNQLSVVFLITTKKQYVAKNTKRLSSCRRRWQKSSNRRKRTLPMPKIKYMIDSFLTFEYIRLKILDSNNKSSIRTMSMQQALK